MAKKSAASEKEQQKVDMHARYENMQAAAQPNEAAKQGNPENLN